MSSKPITHTLGLLDGGAFSFLAGDKLAALVKGVEDTGKTGKLTITLDLKRVGNGAIQIVPTVTAKTPEPKPESSLLWATVEGNLTVENPRQQSLELHQVASRPAELKTFG